MALNDRSSTGGDGERRRRRRRRRRRGGGGGGGSNGNRGQQGNRNRVDPNDCRLKNTASQEVIEGSDELDAFNLFCAYHLGITSRNQYKFQSIGEVARRFKVDVRAIKRKLTEYGLTTEAINKTGFSIKYAQMDIQVAPEGVSRRELAKYMWDEIEPDLEPVELPPEEPAVESDSDNTGEASEAQTTDDGLVDEAEAVDGQPADADQDESEDAAVELSADSDEAELSADSDEVLEDETSETD